MPVEVHFEEPALFVMRAYGAVTVDEVRDAIGEWLGDSRLGPGAAIYIDNREVTSQRTVAEIAVITAEFGKLFARGAKSVAVVTDAELVASQVFASFASTVGGDVRVFRDPAKAREWLAPT
ncbi:MAG: STAS/SEC14 domain-containing protein [Myxococcales bacterium]|nr:STAS/SEC14 domain-containing protein [Myxococcales bacterium]